MRRGDRGVAVASGDLIATCDDDDAWLPGTAAAMAGYLDDHPEVGAATAWHQVVLARRVVDFRGPLVYGSEELLWFNVAAISFIVVRREAFSSDPWYDPAIVCGEDWDLCLRCSLERPFRTVPRVLYQYRQHAGSRITRDFEKQLEGRAALVEKHGALMSRGCLTYHRTVMELRLGGKGAAGRQLVEASLRHPLSGARAATMLAGAWAGAGIGTRRGDPGLAARSTARLAVPARTTSGVRRARDLTRSGSSNARPKSLSQVIPDQGWIEDVNAIPVRRSTRSGPSSVTARPRRPVPSPGRCGRRSRTPRTRARPCAAGRCAGSG